MAHCAYSSSLFLWLNRQQPGEAKQWKMTAVRAKGRALSLDEAIAEAMRDGDEAAIRTAATRHKNEVNKVVSQIRKVCIPKQM